MKYITLGIFQLFTDVRMTTSNDFSLQEENAWSGGWESLDQGGVTYELLEAVAGHQGC